MTEHITALELITAWGAFITAILGAAIVAIIFEDARDKRKRNGQD